jgi:membrane-bound serine protease (ClpP class)
MFLVLFCCVPIALSQTAFPVLKLTIDSAISPAQEEVLVDALRAGEEQGSALLLLVLDTPGGLGESMRSMVSTILNSSIPVAVWVGPPGARAASAGVFLVASSTVAGMAPQTTIGAASPVGLGGEEVSATMAKKMTNDFSSLVKSMAESRGRDGAWYSEAVEKSVSISAREALKLRVIEFVAPTPENFLVQVGKAGFEFKGKRIHFSQEDIELQEYETGFRYEFLSWLIHPQIAYLFILGGMLGLFIELTHPGTVFPGVFGGLCLLLGLYALSVLPTNIVGLLLVLFSLILFMLEIKVVSYGMLSVAAIVSLFVGSVILFKDDYGTLQISVWFILWPVLFLSAAVSAVVFLVARAQSTKKFLGEAGMIGLNGKVLSWEGDSGQIRVRGEIWAAKGARSDFTPLLDMEVKIISINGLTVDIEPLPH